MIPELSIQHHVDCLGSSQLCRIGGTCVDWPVTHSARIVAHLANIISFCGNPVRGFAATAHPGLRPKHRLSGTLVFFLLITGSGLPLVPLALGQPLLQSVLKNKPTNLQVIQLDNVKAMTQAGCQEGAELILRQYLLGAPASAQAHALLGLVKFREGEADKSLDEYSLAAKYGNIDADDLRIVALDYVKLHDLSSAERWLKASIKKENKDWRTWRYLGGVEYSEEHPAEAASAFQECLVLDSKNVLAEDGLARSHEAQGQSERAASEYRMAILWNSKRPDKSWLPLLHYGSYLRRAGRLTESIENLTQAVSISPGDWEAHTELGQAYKAVGDLQAAENEVEIAIKLAPERIRLHMILAQIYRHEGQKDKSAAEIQIYTSLAAKDVSDRSKLDR